jgi:hypothetical protein
MCGWQRVSEGLAKISSPNLWFLNRVSSPLKVYKRVVETGRRLSGWMVGNSYLIGIMEGLLVIRTSGTDTVHFSSKVSDPFASQRICLSLWLCGGFHFFRLFATPPGTVPSNFRMSPFFPTTQPRCASAKPIVLVSSSFICSQFFPRSIE